jgi:hypothetical integral membrane protein (TIGR02206 family)
MDIGSFLDHGVEGEFQYFSLAHFIPIVIMLGCIFLLYKYGDKLKNWKHEENFRIAFAIIILLSDMVYFWHKIYLGDVAGFANTPNIANHLPITVCGWAAMMSGYMLMTKKRGLFEVVYFFVLAGSINALITPAVIIDNGPTHFRYYQFWIEHTSIFIAVFYMIFVFGYKVNVKSIFKSLGVMIVLTIIAIVVNINVEGANYLFLSTTEAGDSVLNFLPSNLGLRILIMGAVVGTLYFLAYLPWIFINKKENIIIE